MKAFSYRAENSHIVLSCRCFNKRRSFLTYWVKDSLLCADLFVSDPPFVCTARTQICAHVKDPISICRKRIGITAAGMEIIYETDLKRNRKLGSALLWLLAFPG